MTAIAQGMAIIPVPSDDLLMLDSIECESFDQLNRSIWTGTSKIIGQIGANIWHASAHVRPRVTEYQKRPWRAFLAKLKNRQNKFRLRVAKWQRIGLNPNVAAGATASGSIPLTGFPPNQYVMREGQYLTIPLPSGHEQLVTLTIDLLTDASGNVTAQFEPELRESPAIGAEAETVNPWLLTRLANNRIGHSLSGGRAEFSFALVEAV